MDAWTYELLVKDIYDKLLGVEGIDIHHRRKWQGKRTGQPHEIDLSFEFNKAGVRFLVLIECKHYGRNVGVEDIAEFAYKLDDIGAHKGILVTTHGFQKGVFAVANAAGIALVKVARPGEFDVNIADIGPPDYKARFFLDYAQSVADGNRIPPIGFDVRNVLDDIMGGNSRREAVEAAVTAARQQATRADTEEEEWLLSRVGPTESGLIAWFNLARHYHRTGKYDQSIRIYKEFLRRRVRLPERRDEAGGNLDFPEVIHYNLACAQAMKGDKDAAFRSLGWLLLCGPRAAKYLAYARKDSDLDSLRGDEEFEAIIRLTAEDFKDEP